MGMELDERKMKMQKVGLGNFILAKHGWLAIYKGFFAALQVGHRARLRD
jgi:hypothetical protein